MGWEEALFGDTPRGLPGKDDAIPGARWADPAALGPDWRHSRSSIFLGYRNGQGIGCGDDRHVMLVAGSRSGKGVSFVIPNLLLYEGSVLAIDPKGELARETARRRAAMGQKVVVLDPFGRSGFKTHHFNPLDEIDPASETAIDDAALLAEALIFEDGSSDKHWIWGARELVKGMILFALTQEPQDRTLSFVRNVLRSPPYTNEKGVTVPGHKVGLRRMAACDAFDGLVAAIGESFLGKEDRELSGLISTADVQLGFLDSKPLAACLAYSDFRLADLKEEPTTVYLCLPAGRMATHAKWLRAIIDLALVMCERVETVPKPPLLFLLEEFPVLGYMRTLEAAAGHIASYGVKLLMVIQDLTQLQKHYGQAWETFLGNAGASIFFGNSDATTLAYVSKKLGVIGFDLRRTSGAGIDARLSGSQLIQEQLQSNHLLEPHEVEAMFAKDTLRALVLYPGKKPLVVRRARYYDDAPLKSLLTPNTQSASAVQAEVWAVGHRS